ncbi:hypothetical protein PACTADRAFT_50515 [Pachysolen tannophilus NRRL Y-2460]|uniref:Uncharacterized protein n=1 Tax=Pachysolen tannophilus NRRL Y-2460 TaxID=669874 RepID=A0A1E4TSB7_PACTA|nr:hypothetical protein PACTADRAFT_50515 [Pachysolen tannophilus NRRL Y-2460]
MPELLLNNSFKVYKLLSPSLSVSLSSVLSSSSCITDLKRIITNSLYADYQSKNGFFYYSDSLFDMFNGNSDDRRGKSLELKEMDEIVEIKLKKEVKTVQEKNYELNYLIIKSKNKDQIPLKSQIFIFFTEMSSYSSTILLVKALPKFNSLMLNFFINDKGLIIKNLKISSIFLKNCLNINFDKLIKYNSDLEISFNNLNTINNSLANISINLLSKNLKTFNKQEEIIFTDDLFNTLNKLTSIDFKQLDITKIRCNLFYLMSDGKLKFFSHDTEDDDKLIWRILTNLG